MRPIPEDVKTRLRTIFKLTDSGAIVWADRSAEDFSARYNVAPDVAERMAQDWTTTKSGRAPRWRMTPNGPAARADNRPVLFWHIVAALGADSTKAQSAADAARAESDTRDARNAVLRLCEISRKTGQIIWRKRTPETSPKTPAPKLNDFNKTWAGRAVPVRAGGVLVIQRKTVAEPQARAWLQEAATPDQDNAPRGDMIGPEYVQDKLNEGKTLQEVATEARRDFPDFGDFDDKTMQKVLQSML